MTAPNPLYDEWKKLGLTRDRFGGYQPANVDRFLVTYKKREELVARYSWAIPTFSAIRWIASRCRRIAEMGAGRGYWANQLASAGVDVVAYEPTVDGGDLRANHWHAMPEAVGLYFDLRNGDASEAAKHSDRTLMLCWPPYDDPMAEVALSVYQGNQLLYIGEGDGGCCGGDGFWSMIRNEWNEVGDHDIPQWHGIRDYITLYERRYKL